MSFLGFNIAGSALSTFQEAENVTSQNIANVQTPGASRQVVNIGQLPPIDGAVMYPNHLNPGTQGDGVLVTSIQRIHQDSYDALFRGASSSSNFFSTEQSALSGLQASMGEPNNGINTALTAFQTALQTLVNNPQGTAERTGVLTAAQGLVTTLNTAGSALQAAQVSVQTQTKNVVGTINTTLDQIAALNSQIRASTAVGDNPNTYEDQRDTLIDTLSTYISTTTSVQADGSTLVTVNGHALVNDTVAYHLATPVIGTNANGTTSLVVGFQNDPNPSNPQQIQVGGGQLGGLLDVYNNKLTPYVQQLNSFANGLAVESDKISQAGYDITGQAGGQLFSPVVTQLPISAGNIQVGIATGSEIPGTSASTQAGTLVQAMNAANATVDTTAALTNNTALANAPAAAMTGSLTVGDDGINQTYLYSTAPDSSTLTAASAIGATTIQVASGSSFVAGDKIVLGTGTDQEIVTVASVAGNTVTISATTKTHQIGEAAGGNASTIGGFINSFNLEHFGVTASYNSTSQTIVFTRDPNNIDLVHRAAVQAAGGTTTPDFTITDSNKATAATPAAAAPPAAHVAGSDAQPGFAVPSTSLLAALGANQINGINQNATNAFGSTSGAGANALLALFSNSYGVPALQTTSSAVVAAGAAVTVTPTAGQPGFSQINVGQVLTLDAGTPNQENVTVTAVNRGTGSISFIAKNAHPTAPAATFSITTAQTQTLQQAYTGFVANVGLDTATAISGATSQATLTSNVDAVRQSTDGINIDEETQNLVKFQNAYGAAAHVISILSSMLSDAINLGSGSSF